MLIPSRCSMEQWINPSMSTQNNFSLYVSWPRNSPSPNMIMRQCPSTLLLLLLFIQKIEDDRGLVRSWLEAEPDVWCLASLLLLRSKSLYQHLNGDGLLQYFLIHGVLDVRSWAYGALCQVEVDYWWIGWIHRCQLSWWSWRCLWWRKKRWRSIRCLVEGSHVDSKLEFPSMWFEVAVVVPGIEAAALL